jgi:predicted XRE-type DNA-binding protein
VLQIDQPKVSALVRRLAGFSLDRLVRFLVLLGSDVEIVVKTRTRAMGRARVMVA